MRVAWVFIFTLLNFTRPSVVQAKCTGDYVESLRLHQKKLQELENKTFFGAPSGLCFTKGLGDGGVGAVVGTIFGAGLVWEASQKIKKHKQAKQIGKLTEFLAFLEQAEMKSGPLLEEAYDKFNSDRRFRESRGTLADLYETAGMKTVPLTCSASLAEFADLITHANERDYFCPPDPWVKDRKKLATYDQALKDLLRGKIESAVY